MNGVERQCADSDPNGNNYKNVIIMNYIYVWCTYIIIIDFLRFCIYLKLRFKALKKNTGDDSSNSSTIYTKNCDQFSIFWRVMCNCVHCWYVLKLEQKREFLRGFVCSSGAWKQTSKNSLIYRYVDSVLRPFALSFYLFHQLLPQRSTTAITLLGSNNLHSWFFSLILLKYCFLSCPGPDQQAGMMVQGLRFQIRN